MEGTLLLISTCSLLLIWFIDFFTAWYAKFLKRWMPHFKIRVLLGQLVWAILAVLFWNTLSEHMLDLVNPAYLFFVLFIYSIRGLIDSVLRNRDENSIYY